MQGDEEAAHRMRERAQASQMAAVGIGSRGLGFKAWGGRAQDEGAGPGLPDGGGGQLAALGHIHRQRVLLLAHQPRNQVLHLRPVRGATSALTA